MLLLTFFAAGCRRVAESADSMGGGEGVFFGREAELLHTPASQALRSRARLGRSGVQPAGSQELAHKD
jgi:hypothetical protein